MTPLNSLRNKATKALENLVFPNSDQEDWKYIDLSAIKQIPWQTVKAKTEQEEIVIPEANFSLVFHNNRFVPDRSVIGQTEQLVLGPVASDSQVLTAHLGKYTDDRDVITHLNSKVCDDLALIYVPPHQTSVASLHYFNQGHHCASHPRSLMILEPHSQLTIVEIHRGNGDVYWSNPVTEIYLGAHSHLNHIILQNQGRSAFHTQTTRVVQSQNSFYKLHTIDVGAHLSRHNLHVQSLADSTSTTLQGLVSIGGEQTADTHSTIVHGHPAGRSNQLHKCILRDRSHGVFNGKVCVSKQGQLTDASQMSRNLLLSPQARIDTKPELQIVADNVKCTHGATVSQLDREEQFYLQSRGIDLESATQLLTYAFAGEIIQSIPLASLRAYVGRIIA